MADWKKIIADHRGSIEEALLEAEKRSYNCAAVIRVELYEDGTTDYAYDVDFHTCSMAVRNGEAVILARFDSRTVELGDLVASCAELAERFIAAGVDGDEIAAYLAECEDEDGDPYFEGRFPEHVNAVWGELIDDVFANCEGAGDYSYILDDFE